MRLLWQAAVVWLAARTLVAWPSLYAPLPAAGCAHACSPASWSLTPATSDATRAIAAVLCASWVGVAGCGGGDVRGGDAMTLRPQDRCRRRAGM